MGFLDKVADMWLDNADKIDTAIDKAGEFVDSKTHRKYSDTVHKAQKAAKKAIGSGP